MYVLLSNLVPAISPCSVESAVGKPAEAKPNLSQLYLSPLSRAKPAKLKVFKTPASGGGSFGPKLSQLSPLSGLIPAISSCSLELAVR